MDERNDPTPHPGITAESHVPDAMGKHERNEISIWFFCGILTLGYGVVLVAQAGLEHFRLLGQHPPTTILAQLHPTFWWGLCLLAFGLFYTVRFRPGKA